MKCFLWLKNGKLTTTDKKTGYREMILGEDFVLDKNGVEVILQIGMCEYYV